MSAPLPATPSSTSAAVRRERLILGDGTVVSGTQGQVSVEAAIDRWREMRRAETLLKSVDEETAEQIANRVTGKLALKDQGQMRRRTAGRGESRRKRRALHEWSAYVERMEIEARASWLIARRSGTSLARSAAGMLAVNVVTVAGQLPTLFNDAEAAALAAQALLMANTGPAAVVATDLIRGMAAEAERRITLDVGHFMIEELLDMAGVSDREAAERKYGPVAADLHDALDRYVHEAPADTPVATLAEDMERIIAGYVSDPDALALIHERLNRVAETLDRAVDGLAIMQKTACAGPGSADRFTAVVATASAVLSAPGLIVSADAIDVESIEADTLRHMSEETFFILAAQDDAKRTGTPAPDAAAVEKAETTVRVMADLVRERLALNISDREDNGAALAAAPEKTASAAARPSLWRDAHRGERSAEPVGHEITCEMN